MFLDISLSLQRKKRKCVEMKCYHFLFPALYAQWRLRYSRAKWVDNYRDHWKSVFQVEYRVIHVQTGRHVGVRTALKLDVYDMRRAAIKNLEYSISSHCWFDSFNV